MASRLCRSTATFSLTVAGPRVASPMCGCSTPRAGRCPTSSRRRNEPLSMALTLKPASEETAPPGRAATDGGQRSIYIVALPDEGLPAATLVLETSARVFQRTVRLGVMRPADRDRRDPYFDARQLTVWRNADEQAPARTLALRVDSARQEDLVLAVDEGDNPALPLAGARLLLPSYRLRFYQDAGSPVAPGLRPRRPAGAAVRPRAPGTPCDGCRGARGVSSSGPRRDVARRRGRLCVAHAAFWIVLAGAVVVLLGLIVRLVRNA